MSYLDKNINKIINADCLDILKQLPDKCIDLVLTDPPYIIDNHGGTILALYSDEGHVVLDCFSGSGTTAVACHNLNRRFICIEKDPDYWATSVKRLEEAQQQLSIFDYLEVAE